MGRTIYCMTGDGASDDDLLLGMMDSPDIAQHICNLHNDELRHNTVLGSDPLREQLGLGPLPEE